MIYLASPYYAPQEKVKAQRADEVARKAASILKRGELVFCPAAHGHMIGQFCSGVDWLELNKWFLKRCDKMIVLTLVGWELSVGVRQEIECARQWKIPIEYEGIAK